MNEWIEVRERMPDYANETILISDGSEVYSGFFSSNHEFCFNSMDVCDEQDFHVSHWMPLPEAPK